MIVGLVRVLTSGAVGAAAENLTKSRTEGSARWERQNFRGNTVNLAGGVGVAAGSLVGAASAPSGLALPSLLVTGVAAAAGGMDDFATDPGAAKGLAGHLKALARGQVTTGAVKLLGISGAAVIAGAAIGRSRGERGIRLALDALTSGALIAGTANLINLFDLRPGRAVKVSALLAAPVAAGSPSAHGRAYAQSALGTAIAAAPGDLGESTMLGDIGANSLGALVGLAYATDPRRAVRLGALATVTSMIFASERVSFSAVIERNRALAWLDHLGRRP